MKWKGDGIWYEIVVLEDYYYTPYTTEIDLF
jgi:hypothetical protein